jgi:hypothetical protein
MSMRGTAASLARTLPPMLKTLVLVVTVLGSGAAVAQGFGDCDSRSDDD